MVTYTISKEPDYHDIDLSLSKNRRSRDLVLLNGVDAIVTSVENLVNMNFYEKPFQPSIGSNVRKLLFDNITELTSIFIRDAIIQVLVNYEPRARILDVSVRPQTDDNRYDVTITFSVLNDDRPIQISTFLTRIR